MIKLKKNNRSIVIKTFKVVDIGFSHADCGFDETEFDISADLDEVDTLTEVMNLFMDFINENHYTGINNVNVYIRKVFNRIETYENGELVNTEEVDIGGIDNE